MTATTRIRRARVIPTVGSPGTLDAGEALRVFWEDYRLWIDVGKPCALKPPRLQVWGPKGLLFEVDGKDYPVKCDHCGWPMLRDPSLDEPIKDCDGVWQGYRCVADKRHTYLEPVD